jgi:hypothetical protein
MANFVCLICRLKRKFINHRLPAAEGRFWPGAQMEKVVTQLSSFQLQKASVKQINDLIRTYRSFSLANEVFYYLRR